jgi:pyrroloquinoline quinone biosynthesis protein E
MVRPNPPIAMLAELTHVCPLACPYCSNPVELTKRNGELDTATWGRVFREAADIGVLQLHLSGGEPASRRDLVDLVVTARQAGLYTNLITSGIGLTDQKLAELDTAGLDHVQLSLQGIRAELADRIGGYKGGFARKMHVVERIVATGFPLTLNAVMHRHNMDDLPETIALALRLGARRIEVACVQFHGWAEANRSQLQPTADQVRAAKATVDTERERLTGKLVIDFVAPDWFADFPKPCMGGWGATGLNITPAGDVLPCHAAESIPQLTFSNVADHSLSDIWYHDAAFNAFRGTDWMPELCQTCDRRDIDFGGCRCQAMAIVGDASATDPICRKSPDRVSVDALLETPPSDAPFIYRNRV